MLITGGRLRARIARSEHCYPMPVNDHSLFYPGSLNPYRPPSLACSGMMILVGLAMCYIPISNLAEYLELRYDTVTTRGVVTNVSTRENTDSGVTESVVAHSFKLPDGSTYTGSVVRPATRVAHLTAGAPVEVFYKSDDPARNTTGDDLFIRLRWHLLPVAAMAIYWFGLAGIFMAQRMRLRRVS